MTSLPEIFLRQMKELLPDGEFEAFCRTYQEPTVRGLRYNRLKAGQACVTYPIPWCPDGTLYPDTERPAKSIFYNAGLFYIQEPSAMCPVEVLKPEPGQRVLDLCAAPGGKSSQIAGHLQGKGLLVSNDASPSRSRALVNNIERMGVTNAVVTTELPKKLAERFPEFFDRVLVDAPCSGEGMFRRDPDAVKAYTANKPAACVAMQQAILRYAAKMLRPGGRLVYSTCTFNTQENEDVICSFLQENKDFFVVPIDHKALGISPGLKDLPQTGRIFPHRATGEGHFVALLEKNCARQTETVGDAALGVPHPPEFYAFCKMHLICCLPPGHFVAHGANLYLQPEPLDLRGIRVARSGWFLGECAKGRFVPSWALAMGLSKQDVRYTVELSEEDARRYLRGESLDAGGLQFATSDKPYVMLCHQSFPLGWARLVQGRLKNCLPVGLVIK